MLRATSAGSAGELTIKTVGSHVAEVVDLCTQMQAETGGYFSPRYSGRLDPTGLVKGWAIEQASRLLARTAMARRRHSPLDRTRIVLS